MGLRHLNRFSCTSTGSSFFSDTSIPFAMEFPHATIALLPEVIAIGEIIFRKVFDKYFLPSFVNYATYRDRFYTYFADKYEHEADLKIKKGVFEGLFNLMPGENLKVLDAACGTGLAFVNRPKDRIREMVGVDSNEKMVGIAQLNGGDARHGRIEELSNQFPLGEFDYVMAPFWDFWEPDVDKPMAFAELRKMVKPGGEVVFNVHKPHSGWEDVYSKLLIGSCGYKSVSFSHELIDRTGGGVYTAYYVVAEV